MSTGDISEENFPKGSTNSTRRDWDTDLTSTNGTHSTHEENSEDVLPRRHADDGTDASATSSNRGSVKSNADQDGNLGDAHPDQRCAKDENGGDSSALNGLIPRSYELDNTHMT